MSKPGTKFVNILVIGTTGSGKSSAVNALINYLANVGYEDDHRLEIVSLEESEKKNIQKGQAESQTDWITVYEICEMRNQKINFQVNIVDTPGFGDTRGKERDNQTFEQIRHLFKYRLTTVDAVCVCLNGTEPRLNDRQKYIFESVMKCFGKDITKNLFIWTTFTDDEKPPVLGSINAYGMEYVTHFSFENGALFEKIPEDERKQNKSKGKFEDVYVTFDNFFEKIKTISPQSLENSRQVLEERNKLRIHRSEIERDIMKTLKCLDDQKLFEKEIEASNLKVISSKDCFFNVKIVEQCREKVFNCETCKRTCCDPCDHYFFSRFSYECTNLSWGNYCKICRCHADKHDHSKFKRYVVKRKSLSEIEHLQSNDSLILDSNEKLLIQKKRDFVEVAQKDKNKKQKDLDDTRSEICVLENHLYGSLMTLHKALNELQRIALYDEKTTVSEILQEIEHGDVNKYDIEAKGIYTKLKNYILKHHL